MKIAGTQLIPTEEQEHIVLAEWLELNRICWHHSPNEGSRSKKVDKQGRVWSPEGNRLKRMGVKKGHPDFMIFDPIFEPNGYYTGTAIELKRRREAYSLKTVAENRVATVEQKEWLAMLGSRGWYTAICYGAEEAIDLLKKLGYGAGNPRIREDEQKLYNLALQKWGEDLQIEQAVEECAELIVAIRHRKRGKNNLIDVAEEIADVEIICGQLRIMIGSEMVDQQKALKLKRLRDMFERKL